VLLIGSFGLYAATKDHHRFLILYSGIMSVVFIIQFITGVVGLSVKNSDKFSSWVSKTFSAEFSVNTTMTHERDFYQQFFGCCGWNGTIDYTDPANGLNAPLSCCKVSKTVCNVTETASLFDAKCSDKLMAASRRVIEVACGTLVAFAVFNFISIVLSVMMSRQIKNGYQYT
jgi:putative Ca2+/H+ antiporter (TMEM165/GDT1 family)